MAPYSCFHSRLGCFLVFFPLIIPSLGRTFGKLKVENKPKYSGGACEMILFFFVFA